MDYGEKVYNENVDLDFILFLTNILIEKNLFSCRQENVCFKFIFSSDCFVSNVNAIESYRKTIYSPESNETKNSVLDLNSEFQTHRQENRHQFCKTGPCFSFECDFHHFVSKRRQVLPCKT